MYNAAVYTVVCLKKFIFGILYVIWEGGSTLHAMGGMRCVFSSTSKAGEGEVVCTGCTERIAVACAVAIAARDVLLGGCFFGRMESVSTLRAEEGLRIVGSGA